MATDKVNSAQPLGESVVEDDVLATAHRLAAALHRVGAMDELTMRDMDRLCLPPRRA